MGRHRTAVEKVELGERARALREQGWSRRRIERELGVGNDLLTVLLAGTEVPDALRRPRAKDDLRVLARRMRARGATYDEVADELGVSTSTCSLWLRDLPLPEAHEPAPEPQPVAPEDAERCERARAMRAGGAFVCEVAVALGVDVPTAFAWCEGVPAPGHPRVGHDRGHVRAMSRARWDRELAVRERERTAVKAAAAQGVGPVTPRDLLLALAVSYWCEGAKSKPWRRVEQVRWTNSDPGLVTLFLAGLELAGVERGRIAFRLSIHEGADEAAARRWWAAHVGVEPETFQCTSLKRHNPRTVRRNTGEGYRGCLVVTVRRGRLLYQVLEGVVQGLLAGADVCSTTAVATASGLDKQSAVG